MLTFDYLPDAGGGSLSVWLRMRCPGGTGSFKVYVDVTPPSTAKPGEALVTEIEVGEYS